METPKILLIDDDVDVKNTVAKALNPLVSLDYAQTLAAASNLTRVNNYTLVLLDIFLGDENGIDLLELRQHTGFLDPAHTIIITSDKDLENEIKGHDLGVRDFLRKPFNCKLLRSILDKHLMQVLKTPKKSICEGPFFLDLIKHEGYIDQDGHKNFLDLTQKEFQILKFFIERKGQVFSRDVIFDRLWDEESNSLSRTVDMHISSLRKKIIPFSDAIKNKRSIGYFFELGE